MKLYIYNQLLVLDCGLNALFGGSPFETYSSRLGRHYATSRAARVVADIIDWVAFHLAGEMNHCKSNILLASHYEGREVLE
ncbi:MAG: hypothetical protein HIU83_17690 [Proteobacteria bacterium]|nr:hypothetical protein [Pseudomonadota bacterium]